MNKTLHILRSEPTALVRRMIEELPGETVALYRGAVDYSRLVEQIFGSGMVICWW